jgi:hypothetical protein
MDAKILKTLKLAELLGSTGALVLGIGVGAWAATWIGPTSGVLVLLGAALHARGMILKHRAEASLEVPHWWVWLYRLCWVGLVVAGLWVLIDLR